MYGVNFDMSDEAMKDDFVLPIGKAKIEREGIKRNKHMIKLQCKVCLIPIFMFPRY